MSEITWSNSKRKLSDLIPWDINPATIGKDEAERLEESLAEFGQVETIAISPENEIYDGHQRQTVWGASAKFGKEYEVDVRVSSRPLTERERKKLVIYLRKGAVGHFDWDLLANNWDVPDLLEWGFSEKELQLGGFDLDQPNGEDPGAQIDKAEELREKWQTSLGQMWKLGEHRLICGDCTDRAVVERVMMGERADLYITDPPYNIGFSAQRNKESYKDTSDDLGGDEYLSLVENAYLSAMEHAEKAIVTCGKQNLKLWMKNFKITDVGIWIAKNKMSGGRISNLSLWEPVLFLGKFDRKSRANDLFEFSTKFQPEADDHPCPKVLDLWEEFIKCYSTTLIIDGFLGSGTTLIACERLSRKCRAVEISPAYCAVAIERWATMTGGTPELLQDTVILQK